jgi:ArsR family transcriptional regulator
LFPHEGTGTALTVCRFYVTISGDRNRSQAVMTDRHQEAGGLEHPSTLFLPSIDQLGTKRYICLSEYTMPTQCCTEIDRIFRALSDKTRLRIMALLQGGELCVCDIVSVLDVPQPTASRHLAYLRRAGLVLTRKEGQWHYYRLSPAKSSFHSKVLDCLHCCLSELPEVTQDMKRLRRSNRSARCCD